MGRSKQPSAKQDLARKRNWAKHQIVGIAGRILQYREAFTPEENELTSEIEERLKDLLNNWDENSIKLGLTVLPRCWCGKIARHHPVPVEGKISINRMYCKEHSLDWHEHVGLVGE